MMGKGGDQPGDPLPTGSSPSYRAELGLQVDLQALDGASQLRDLRLAALELLRVDGHLAVQLLRLQEGQAVPLQPGEGAQPQAPCAPWCHGQVSELTLLKNHCSASLRFFSARVSYCSLMSVRILVRSMPGAASISTLISPPTCPRRAFISCRKRDTSEWNHHIFTVTNFTSLLLFTPSSRTSQTSCL